MGVECSTVAMETASGMLWGVKEDVKTRGGGIPHEEMELVRFARVELGPLILNNNASLE